MSKPPAVFGALTLSLLLLLLAGTVFAQPADPWDRPDLPLDALEAAWKSASAAAAALDAGDMDKAAAELGVTVGIAGRTEEWTKAVRERLDALDPKLLPATIQEGKALRTMADVRDMEARASGPLPAPDAPPSGDRAGEHLEAIKLDHTGLREKLEAAERTYASRSEQLALVTRQLAELPAERERLSRLLTEWEANEGDPLDAYRRATLRLRLRTVQERLAFAERAKPVWDALLAVRELERKRARTILAAHDDILAAAQAAFDAQAEVKAEKLKKAADRKRAEAAAPDLPEGERLRLLAAAEADDVRAAIHQDQILMGQIERRSKEEEAENRSLRETQEWLRERFDEEGGERSVSRRTVQLLLSTLARVRSGLRRLDRELFAEREKFLGAYLSGRADVEDRRRELMDDERAGDVLSALRERRTGLEKVKSALKDLDRVYKERRDLLNDLYPFLVRRAYWVQSDEPLGIATLSGIRDEVVALATLYTGSRLWVDAGRASTSSWKYAIAGLVFILLVGLGIVLTRRLSSYQTRWKYRGGAIAVLIQRLGASLLLSSLAPGCLALSLLPLAFLDLPPALDLPGARLLLGASVVLFVRRFLWSLLRENGIAREQMRASDEVSDQLLGLSRWLTAAFLFLWLPWWVLHGEPLELVRIPRVLYTALLVVMATLLSLLIRRGGALVAAVTRRKGFWYRAWTFLGPLFSLGFFGIVLMDVLGYRVGAGLLTRNVAETILAGLLLAGAYNIVTGLVGQASSRLHTLRRADLGAAKARKEATEVESQITRFIGVAVVVCAVMLMANFWGIAAGVAGLLGSMSLYGEALTLWDVFAALLWIAGGHFVVRHLAALYEVLVFNRMGKLETGTRYVILAVSKYLVLIVVYAAAALALRLSFASLGYILAALSLGIGFGLQEIVSNFVAGLILLFERPIRVGDLISVGTMFGTVERINIRSTQLVNLDRQVIIIPNRKFITEDVTNWTHNDLLVRSKLEVGVSYGSDVEKVGRVLLETVQSHPKVLAEPAPKALFMTFGDSSLNMRLLYFTLIEDRLETASQLNGKIHARFAEEGIEIPFPQRDLHIRSVQDDTLLSALDREAAARLPDAAKTRRGSKRSGEEPQDPPAPESEDPSP